MMKEVDERIDVGIVRWFGHVERRESDKIGKRVYAGDCEGSCSVGYPRHRWIDTMMDCLKIKKRLGCQA